MGGRHRRVAHHATGRPGHQARTEPQEADSIRTAAPHQPFGHLYNLVSQQTILTSLKELFGIICICGTLLLVCIFTYRLWKRHIPLRYRG